MKTKHKRQSIGKEKAIALAETKWWEGRPAKDVARFQLLTDELAMPFGVFHEKLEEALGRPVFTHEIALNFDGIVDELLDGKSPPTPQEIIELIPEEKRIVAAL